MTDEQNPYNPESYNPADYEIFYLCNKETKEALPIYKQDKTKHLYYFDTELPDDHLDHEKYEVISEYSPKIKGYTVI